MNFILRVVPVVIGWIIWRKTGNIIIGAVVASILETFLNGLLSGNSEEDQ